MFKPRFTYTHDIVNNLIEITSAREIILNAYLVPKWEVSLRKEALIRATHASTAIEGNPLHWKKLADLPMEGKSQLQEGQNRRFLIILMFWKT